MPIKATDFIESQPGLKWNRRAKCALFDVRGPSGKRLRRVLPFDSGQEGVSSIQSRCEGWEVRRAAAGIGARSDRGRTYRRSHLL